MTLILATGGLGFIGSHTCLSLLEQNFEVLIIDSLINSKKETYEKLKQLVIHYKISSENIFFRKGDIRDTKWLSSIFAEFQSLGNPIEAVIHFAGLKSANESIFHPLKYWDANVNTTISLLRTMDEFKCNNIIFSSSATIYKPDNNKTLLECFPKQPINPYGNSKLTIERLLNDLYNSNKGKWNIINLRYFNPVGCHSSGLIGENPNGIPNNLFPIIVKILKSKNDKLSIFGNDWPTKDGTCVRDYIHVVDLAESHIAALKFILNNEPQILNLNVGTGLGTSVLEIVNHFNRFEEVDLKYEFTHRRIGDAAFVVANNKLALEKLNWSPKRNIIDICRDTLNWITKTNLQD